MDKLAGLFRWKVKKEVTKMSAKDAFAVFDADGSGALSVEELRQVLTRPTGGHALSNEEVRSIMAEVDANGDGELQIDEFAEMWAVETAKEDATKRQGTRGKGNSTARGAASPRGHRPGGIEKAKSSGSSVASSSSRGAAPRKASLPTAGELASVEARRKEKEEALRQKRLRKDLVGSNGALAGTDDAGEYEETGDEPEGEWAASKWLAALGISKVITKALKVPSRDVMPAFDYVKKLTPEGVHQLCLEAGIGGLAQVLIDGIDALKAQPVASSSALNDKFQASGKFQMSYGSLSLFYGGLESLLGPPQMVKDPSVEDSPATLLRAMEADHTRGDDAQLEFRTTNGMATRSALEWEFVTYPQKKPEVPYPEREGLRESHPECCRVPRSIDEMLEVMEVHANAALRQGNHSEMIVEELLAGRLYTGPMYMKYNATLRAKSKNEYLIKQWRSLCHGNSYVTTIHAVNSCVLKLSKLTKAGKVWRGIKDAKLPKEFWVPNEMGVRGGIEYASWYGFSSTTTDKSQAQAYASFGGKSGDAMTIFEMQMGMVDRGANLTWLSQYPHEREVLLPPLTGIEALTSDVEGQMLVIHSRLSLNLSAQTLEQVLSRRRKMLMDMAKGIELELRDSLNEELYPVALKILRKALDYGAYSYLPEWFNNDDNFARVMQETLYLQRILVSEVSKLSHHLDKPELSLKGWKARGPARILLLAGFMHARTGTEAVLIDLRESHLQPQDGEQLAQLLTKCPRLTAVDVRGNETLGEAGSRALTDFMATAKVKSSISVPRSLNGVTPSRSSLTVPKSVPTYESRLLVAELEANVFAEGVSAGMGVNRKGAATLNRRGAQAADAWQPLIWAAKDNNMLMCQLLLNNGHDVNKREPAQDKGTSGYAPLHWAAQKGHVEILNLLLSHGANPLQLDKHNNTPYALAEKKGEKEVLAILETATVKYQKSGGRPAATSRKASISPQDNTSALKA